MPVALQMDVSDLVELIEEATDRVSLTKDEHDHIAFEAIRRINVRTAKGVDYTGSTFEYYSGLYARFRALEGRQVEKVDLQFDGQMFAAMTVRSSEEAAIIGFNSASEGRKAQWHNEGSGNLPERRFLDIQSGSQEARELGEIAASFMARKF